MISSSIISNSSNEIQNYVLIKEIKKGGEGSVCKFFDKSTSEILAIKKMKIDNHQKQEFELLENLEHENIMIPKKVFFMTDNFNDESCCLVFKLMEKDFHDYLNDFRAKNENLPEMHCLILMDSMIQALFYLKQAKKISHRDIKPQNILIKQGLQKSPSFYLTDFGVSKSTQEKTITHTIVGTKTYMAPEILKELNAKVEEAHYDSFKTDIFSLGLVFLESITMETVKSLNENNDNLSNKINLVKNQNFKVIIEKMLEFDAKKRITLEELKNEFEEKFYKQINFNVVDSFDQKYQVKLTNFNTVFDLYREIGSQITTNQNKFDFVFYYSQKDHLNMIKISWKNFKEKLIAFDFPTDCTLFLGPISNENRYRILVSYYYDNVPLEEIEEKYVFLIETTRQIYINEKVSSEWSKNYEICEDFTNCPCYLVPREKFTNDTDTIIIGKKEGIVNKNIFYVILDGNNMKPLQFEQKYFVNLIKEIKKKMNWSEIKEIVKKRRNPNYLFFVNSVEIQNQLYEILLETIKKQRPNIRIAEFAYINESYLVLYESVKLNYN